MLIRAFRRKPAPPQIDMLGASVYRNSSVLDSSVATAMLAELEAEFKNRPNLWSRFKGAFTC